MVVEPGEEQLQPGEQEGPGDLLGTKERRRTPWGEPQRGPAAERARWQIRRR